MRRRPRWMTITAVALALCVAAAGCESNSEAPAAPPMPAGGYPKGAPAAPGVMPAKGKARNKGAAAPTAD